MLLRCGCSCGFGCGCGCAVTVAVPVTENAPDRVSVTLLSSVGVVYPKLYKPNLAPQHSTMTQPINKRLKTLDFACFSNDPSATQEEKEACFGAATTDSEGVATLTAAFDSRGKAGEYKVRAVI